MSSDEDLVHLEEVSTPIRKRRLAKAKPKSRAKVKVEDPISDDGSSDAFLVADEASESFPPSKAKAKKRAAPRGKAKAKPKAKAKVHLKPLKKKADDEEDEVNTIHHYRKAGQKFHIPSNGDGIRVFYESLFHQNVNDYIAIKYMVEYGCLEMDSIELSEAFEKYTFLRERGAFKRMGGVKSEFDDALMRTKEKYDMMREQSEPKKEMSELDDEKLKA
eukprot:GHVH01000841.1.p1 GENE.GHVH01000841.1~~GHVH01000841.1.p1  ORF type:complete len:218 (+),score=49.65 GHVH01000841.1:57-710(+)